jgi:hypothetical protein
MCIAPVARRSPVTQNSQYLLSLVPPSGARRATFCPPSPPVLVGRGFNVLLCFGLWLMVVEPAGLPTCKRNSAPLFGR